MPLPPATKLGPYEIIAPLGAGGMGEVYRARDTRLGRDVAIKVLPSSLANDADRLQRFEQEARVLGTLNHPNLLAIFDVGRTRPARTILSPNFSKAKPFANTSKPVRSRRAKSSITAQKSRMVSPLRTIKASSTAI